LVFFFFSSRRRHTRSKRDWSSDVCSSDLFIASVRPPFANPDWSLNVSVNGALNRDYAAALPDNVRQLLVEDNSAYNQSILYRLRSEERRVGKEWRSGVWP